MNRQQARKTAEKRLKKGGSYVPQTVEELGVKQVQTFPALFQFRTPKADDSESHIIKLHRAIKRQGKPLQAVKVFWLGDAWVCIDGHHRLQAYKRAIESGHWQEVAPIPVEAFTGTLVAAIKEANAENPRAALQMDDGQKEEAAWQLVTTVPELSKKEVADQAGVGTTTVANMRRALKFIQENHSRNQPSEFPWWQARRMERDGEDGSRMDAEAARRERVQKMAAALHKKFGDVFKRDPSLLAEVLKEYDEDILRPLQHAITDQMRSEDEPEGNPEALPFP